MAVAVEHDTPDEQGKDGFAESGKVAAEVENAMVVQRD